jgi:hypothetical protein
MARLELGGDLELLDRVLGAVLRRQHHRSHVAAGVVDKEHEVALAAGIRLPDRAIQISMYQLERVLGPVLCLMRERRPAL